MGSFFRRKLRNCFAQIARCYRQNKFKQSLIYQTFFISLVLILTFKIDNMRKLLIVSGLLFIAGAFFSVNAQSNKSVAGKWQYSVPEAPSGYEKGVIFLVEKDKALSGDLVLDSGYKVKLSNVSLKSDTLRLGAYVESEYVTVVSKVKGNKIEGKVDTSMGILGLKAEKK